MTFLLLFFIVIFDWATNYFLKISVLDNLPVMSNFVLIAGFIMCAFKDMLDIQIKMKQLDILENKEPKSVSNILPPVPPEKG